MSIPLDSSRESEIWQSRNQQDFRRWNLHDRQENDEQDAESEEEGVALDVADLETAEELSDSGGGESAAAHCDAVDEEFIDNIHEGGDAVLPNGDEFGVDFIEVKFVGKEADVHGVLVLAAIEHPGKTDPGNERGEGGDADGREDHADQTVGLMRLGRVGEECIFHKAIAGEKAGNDKNEQWGQHDERNFVRVGGTLGTGFAQEGDDK